MAERIPEHWVSTPVTHIPLEEAGSDTRSTLSKEAYDYLLPKIAASRDIQFVNQGGISSSGVVDAVLTDIITNSDNDTPYSLAMCEPMERCTRRLTIEYGSIVITCAATSFDTQKQAEKRDDTCLDCHGRIANTAVRVLVERAEDVRRKSTELETIEAESARRISTLRSDLKNLL